jgi:membrane protease YdiL (CAAX protease family)
MSGIRDLVSRFPLSSFFVLAFGVSWMAWTPFILSTSGLGLEQDIHIPKVLGTTQIVGMLPGAYLGPLTAALIVTALSDGRAGLRHWRQRLVRWRVGLRWYLAILVGVPTVILVTTLALPGAWAQIRVPALIVFAGYVPMLVVQFFTTAVAEEPGWRDFALPRLQRRYGPTVGTLVLGLLWGCWHLPLFFTEWGGWPDVSWVRPLEFVVSCVPLSIVMTWVFNRTGQSLPIVMVLHASINATYSLIWSEVFPHLDGAKDGQHSILIASVIAALILLIATRGKLGLSSDDNLEVAPAAPPGGRAIAPYVPDLPTGRPQDRV